MTAGRYVKLLNMTQPTTPGLSDALLAERYGFPVVEGRTARLIASLHALINFLLEHPDLPVATTVKLFHHPLMAGTVVTPDELAELARAYGGYTGSSEENRWAVLPIVPGSGDMAPVELAVFAGDGPAGRRRPL